MSQAETAHTTISEKSVQLISRADALAAGMPRFFTGLPCKYGHIAERTVVKYECLACKRAHANDSYADPVKGVKIQARLKRYQVSEHGKKTVAVYQQSDEWRAINKAALAKYRASPKGRAAISAYDAAPARKKTAADQSRFRNYGMSPVEYDAMLSKQENRCAICRTDTPLGPGAWHVDHCHTTKAVRGLLCHHCNVGLGHFKDSAALLSAAGTYLQSFEEN